MLRVNRQPRQNRERLLDDPTRHPRSGTDLPRLRAMTFEPLLPIRHDFGEGPVWHADDQALWFVDIPGRRIFRVSWADRQLQSWSVP